MDSTDWQVIEALQENARLSFAAVGRRVKLSPPAVAERVKRMEDQGVIARYQAVVRPEKLGKPLSLFIRITLAGRDYGRFYKFVADTDAIVECHHVSGVESFLMRAAVESVASVGCRNC